MRRAAFALVTLAALGAVPAAAHHSFDLAFDRSAPVSLTGTVTAFEFADPHTYFKLEVVDADGNPREWHVETTSARQLGAHGWGARSIARGQTLAVEGYAARDGRAYIKLQSMREPGGGEVALWLPAGPAPIGGG